MKVINVHARTVSAKIATALIAVQENAPAKNANALTVQNVANKFRHGGTSFPRKFITDEYR